MAQEKESFVSVLKKNGITLTEKQNKQISEKLQPAANFIQAFLFGPFLEARFKDKLDEFKTALYGIKNFLDAGIITNENIVDWIMEAYAKKNPVANIKFALLSICAEPLLYLDITHKHLGIKDKISNEFNKSGTNNTEFISWINYIYEIAAKKQARAVFKREVLKSKNKNEKPSIDKKYKYDPLEHKSIVDVLRANDINLTDEQFAQIALIKDGQIFKKFLTEICAINALYKAEFISNENVTKWITQGYKNVAFFGVQSKFSKIAENLDEFIKLTTYKRFDHKEILAREFIGNGKIIGLDLIEITIKSIKNNNREADKILSDEIIDSIVADFDVPISGAVEV